MCIVGLTVLMGLNSALATPGAQTVDTDPLNRTPEVREAFEHFYNMDYDGAITLFNRVLQAHPHDPLAMDFVLDTMIFRELNRLDLLDTTFYTNDGFLTGKHTVVEDTAVRDRVRQMAGDAIAAADARLNQNSEDVNALYARGWARGLEATYIAMVERGFASALHMALQARSDESEALRLDPRYVDANLIVGAYQYVVGALPFSFRLLIGIAGIKGNKEKGMEMLRQSADHGVTTSVEARTCMMLFLRREAKYSEALDIAHSLAAQYPHDFLFHLEEANLAKDAGTGMHAIDLYRRLIAQSQQPGYFYSPHVELANFGLGEALRGQKLFADAVAAYRSAAYSTKTSLELKRRCLLAAGKSLDLMGDHKDAVTTYQQVVDAGSDTVQADEARKWMKKGYSGE
jgi:tetratricopeptide (TPR) repeat protein